MFCLLFGFSIRVSTLKTLANEPEAVSESIEREDAALFNDLLGSGLVRVEADGVLTPAPSDIALAEAAEREEHPDMPYDAETAERREELVKDLYGSPAGRIVRTQMRLWNGARRLIAIRDNRPTQPGRRASQWEAVDPEYPGWRHSSVNNMVPESFGFIHGGRLQPNFNDWLSARTDGEPLVLKSKIHVESETPISVQVIGKTERVAPNPVRTEYRCEGEVESCGADNAPAQVLHFLLPPGETMIEVMVSTVPNAEKRIPGLNIYMTAEGKIAWRTLQRSGAIARPSFRVKTSDNVFLTDSEGRPTSACEAAGLVPLIGVGPQTPYALYGILSRSILPPDVEEVALTVDFGLQSKTQTALSEQIGAFWPDDEYAEERRGGLVMLDADTGAILAAASYPQPPAGVHPWDVASFARVYPLKNPVQVRGWQGLDRHNAPGSTFKTVVALAGMKAAEDNPKIADYLAGYRAADFEGETGLGLDCAVYHPATGKCFHPRRIPAGLSGRISNFRRETIRRFLDRSGSDTFGLREAVCYSVNIWFARLAALMDGDKARAYDQAMIARREGEAKPTYPDFQLANTASMMGFGDSVNLAENLPNGMNLLRLSPRGRREGDVLWGGTGKVNLMDPSERGLLTVLTQNAIGQGVMTSPFQMARVVSAIAAGWRLNPFIFERLGDWKTRLPEKDALDASAHRLAILKKGMKAVTEKGTAFGAFEDHSLRSKIYGKTGTAEIRGRDGLEPFNTTWFVGWREPIEGDRRRVVFACMVTHAHGEKTDTGGRVCAPIVAKILNVPDAPVEDEERP